MISKLLEEDVVLLKDAWKLVPGRPHSCTPIRWGTIGVRGCRLETCLIGGRRYTSREALERFFASISSQGPAPAQDVSDAVSAAEAELDQAGI